VMAGAVTNTPSLGAAKAALAELSKHHPEKVFADPTLTYAIAYPFGIVAIILLLIVAKWLYKTKPQEQLLEYKNQVKQQHPEPENVKIRVNQMAWFGKTLKEWKAQTGIE
ncbi:hypothetical protein, partial [Umezakia ovalisporum]|uniref:aspartate-alanine antiporter-like transporter n=1 Tax=Umezakia ovalisporum TaxID=75695 RepID=UPI0039C5BA75